MNRTFTPAILILAFAALGFGMPPFLESPVPDTSVAPGDSLVLSMLDHFTDIEDGDLLGLLDWSATPAHLCSLQAKGVNHLIIRAKGTSLGMATVKVRVTDSEQFIAADSFTVSVVAAGIRESHSPAMYGANIRILRMADNRFRFQFDKGNAFLLRVVDAHGRMAGMPVVGHGPVLEWKPRSAGAGVYFAMLQGERSNLCRRFVIR